MPNADRAGDGDVCSDAPILERDHPNLSLLRKSSLIGFMDVLYGV
jgi:hypothetical protein